MGKYGPNHEQVEAFVEAARSLTVEDRDVLGPQLLSGDRLEAEEAAIRVGLSASQRSAVDSLIRDLKRDLLSRLIQEDSTAERLANMGLTSPLAAAVWAVAGRHLLDEGDVELVVGPFAERLGIDWRGAGEGSV